MGKKGQAPELIIAKLCEAGVSLAKGKSVAKTCWALGVCEQTLPLAQRVWRAGGRLGQEAEDVGARDR